MTPDFPRWAHEALDAGCSAPDGPDGQSLHRSFYNERWWCEECAAENIAIAIKSAYRAGIEDAAKVAHKRAESAQAVIDGGKGIWPNPGYIKDDDWHAVHRERTTAEAIERTISALVTK